MDTDGQVVTLYRQRINHILYYGGMNKRGVCWRLRLHHEVKISLLPRNLLTHAPVKDMMNDDLVLE